MIDSNSNNCDQEILEHERLCSKKCGDPHDKLTASVVSLVTSIKVLTVFISLALIPVVSGTISVYTSVVRLEERWGQVQKTVEKLERMITQSPKQIPKIAGIEDKL